MDDDSVNVIAFPNKDDVGPFCIQPLIAAIIDLAERIESGETRAEEPSTMPESLRLADCSQPDSASADQIICAGARAIKEWVMTQQGDGSRTIPIEIQAWLADRARLQRGDFGALIFLLSNTSRAIAKGRFLIGRSTSEQ